MVWLTEGVFLKRKGELVRGFEELDAMVYPATMWHELMMMIMIRRSYREEVPMWNKLHQIKGQQKRRDQE